MQAGPFFWERRHWKERFLSFVATIFPTVEFDSFVLKPDIFLQLF